MNRNQKKKRGIRKKWSNTFKGQLTNDGRKQKNRRRLSLLLVFLLLTGWVYSFLGIPMIIIIFASLVLFIIGALFLVEGASQQFETPDQTIRKILSSSRISFQQPGKEIPVSAPKKRLGIFSNSRVQPLTDPKGVIGSFREADLLINNLQKPTFIREGRVIENGDDLKVRLAQTLIENRELRGKVRKSELDQDAEKGARDAFLAWRTHELRTPVTGAIGIIDLLLGTYLTNPQREYILSIQRSMNTLLALTNDTLDLSKIEAGKMELERAPFDLERVLASSINLLIPKATKNGVDILIDIDSQIPVNLIGDSLRLQQVVTNLISNAIKAIDTNKGSVIIEVKRSPTGTGSRRFIELLFSVKDTGIGIKSDILPKLFQSYTQAEVSTARKYGGTGLGLPICKQLVEMMQGRIWVESEFGQGTTFYFTANFGYQELESKLRIPRKIRKQKILVVDDSEEVLIVTQKILESFGFEVIAANSAWQALEMMEKFEFGLVIIDWKMPEITGIDLVKEIRNFYDVLIIVMSSHKDEAIQQARKERVEIDLFISKPAVASTLSQAVIDVFTGEGKRIENTFFTEIDNFLTNIRILLAEDDPVNQQVAVKVIEEIGIEVEIVDDGRLVIEAIQQKSFDLILLDINMPEMDGYETAKMIRQNPESKTLLLVAMTAHAGRDIEKKCLEAGMDGCIDKPLTSEKFSRVLVDFIKIPIESLSPGRDLQKINKSDQVKDLNLQLSELESADLSTAEFIRKKLLVNPDFEKTLRIIIQTKKDEETVKKIRESFKQKDWKTLEGLAHKTKGMAGIVGDVALKEVMSKLEIVSEATYKGVNPTLVDQAVKILDDSLKVIQSFLPAETEKTAEEKVVKEMDRDDFLSKIIDLIKALHVHDPVSGPQIFEKVASYFDGRQEQKIRSYLNKYDHKEALRYLLQILKEMGFSEKDLN